MTFDSDPHASLARWSHGPPSMEFEAMLSIIIPTLNKAYPSGKGRLAGRLSV
jgi:hypothetical protein